MWVTLPLDPSNGFLTGLLGVHFVLDSWGTLERSQMVQALGSRGREDSVSSLSRHPPTLELLSLGAFTRVQSCPDPLPAILQQDDGLLFLSVVLALSGLPPSQGMNLG